MYTSTLRVGKYIPLGGYACNIYRVAFYTLNARAYTIKIIIVIII